METNTRTHLGAGFVVTMLLLISFLGGPLIPGPPAKAEAGQSRINTSIANDIVNLDPTQMSIGPDRMVAHQVLEGLVQFNCATIPCRPEPRLAESFTISEDAKTVTFRLRKGVQFHGGYGEFTSEDAAFNLNRHVGPKTASIAKTQARYVDRVETPDKYTMVVRLSAPSAVPLIRDMAWQNLGMIMSKKAIEKLGTKVALQPIGTGPFAFESWNPGEKVVLKKFKEYWGRPAQVEEVNVWVLPEEVVALRALERGEIDITPITQQGSYAIAQKLKGAHILESPAAAYHHNVMFNAGLAPLNDKRVRKALLHALNIKEISKRLGPQTMLWPSPLPSAVSGATAEYWNYEYDVQKAKRLLAEAGYPNGFEMKLIYKQESINETIALEVMNDLKKVVNAKLELIDPATYYPRVREYKHHAAFIFITRFSPDTYSEFFQKGPQNFYNFSSAELDGTIAKAKTSKSEDEAVKHWKSFQKAAIDEALGAWVATLKSQMAVRNDVKGLSPKSLLPYRGLVDLKEAYFAR